MVTRSLETLIAELNVEFQMSDALSRNVLKRGAGVELLLANCLAHGRRQFVEVVGNFLAECRYVLETLGGVYANDAVTKERKMTLVERLEFHRQHSQPLMEALCSDAQGPDETPQDNIHSRLSCNASFQR